MIHMTAHDTLSSAAAGAAVVSPWWLPQLHHVSTIAAEVLPILGALWLIVQIVTHILKTRKALRDHDRQ